MNRINKSLLAVLLCLAMLAGCQTPTAVDTLEVHMLEVGNADCFLVKQGKAAMLIDGGEADDADAIVSYLHAHGVERLTAVMLSHPHADHIGSLQRVIEAYDVGAVIYTELPEGVEAQTPLQTRLKAAIGERGVPTYDVRDGAELALGEARVEIYPVTGVYADANDYSLIARVTFGQERVLFTGDATEEAQKALLDSGADIAAEIIKISHHGGQVNTTEAFLDRVGAELALIPCGLDNTYGHPHDQTLAALEERGITYYRADLCGNTVIVADGQGQRFITTAR